VKILLHEFDVCFFVEEESFSCCYFEFWNEEDEQLVFFGIEIKEEAKMKLAEK
jgi:hypothetical protein